MRFKSVFVDFRGCENMLNVRLAVTFELNNVRLGTHSLATSDSEFHAND
jgi:hypothetical protein